MTLPLGSVWKAEDHRDNLDRAGKYEIWQFAKANGINEITYEMPTEIARKILRSRGVTNIGIPERPLGDQRRTVYNAESVPPSPPQPQTENKSMTADELLEAQYRTQAPSEPVSKAPNEMSIRELRTACKQRGIKMDRRDNLKTLREKLSGQDAA